ncbi:MAG TPA: 50S ribosomal protein L17 [Parafilimonas sp.]|nr:50S ribosomal protein L17 [Parafilimonas sp.]
MRHGDKIKNLSRTKAHRDALLANLGSQLIVNKRIVTTLAKAKALRVYVEPLITKTRKGESQEQIMHQHRVVFSYLKDKHAVKELFTVVAPKVSGRPGGYTRIIKLGTRIGDNAELAMIELVDFNDVYNKTTAATTEAGKRTRRGRSKKSASPKAETTATKAAEVSNEAPTPVATEETAQPPVEGEANIEKGTEE